MKEVDKEIARKCVILNENGEYIEAYNELQKMEDKDCSSYWTLLIRIKLNLKEGIPYVLTIFNTVKSLKKCNFYDFIKYYYNSMRKECISLYSKFIFLVHRYIMSI